MGLPWHNLTLRTVDYCLGVCRRELLQFCATPPPRTRSAVLFYNSSGALKKTPFFNKKLRKPKRSRESEWWICRFNFRCAHSVGFSLCAEQCPIAESLTHITEKIDPNMIINAGSKNWVMEAGIVQSPSDRSTFLSANNVKDVPACSKQAQKVILINMKITRAIILSLQIGPSLAPADIKL